MPSSALVPGDLQPSEKIGRIPPPSVARVSAGLPIQPDMRHNPPRERHGQQAAPEAGRVSA